jgi:hypothetical protein
VREFVSDDVVLQVRADVVIDHGTVAGDGGASPRLIVVDRSDEPEVVHAGVRVLPVSDSVEEIERRLTRVRQAAAADIEER